MNIVQIKDYNPAHNPLLDEVFALVHDVTPVTEVICLDVLKNLSKDIRNHAYFVVGDIMFRDMNLTQTGELPVALALENIEFSGKKYEVGSLFRYQCQQSSENLELLFVRKLIDADIKEVLEFLELLKIGSESSRYSDVQNDEYELLKEWVSKDSTPESVVAEMKKMVIGVC